MSDEKIILEACSLGKTYKDGKIEVTVFKDLNLQIKAKERVAILGASGAGKSTLLHLLGTLDKPTTGSVLIDGLDPATMSEKKRCRLRNEKLGFIYQLHHLLPEFTVLENACMPLLLGNLSQDDLEQHAVSLLEKVGMGHRLHHKIGELSGGERQRTAIVRALVARPVCVFADEPTGNLDRKTADKVYDAMLELNQEIGTSFVIVTHDQSLAKRMDRTLMMEDGCLVER